MTINIDELKTEVATLCRYVYQELEPCDCADECQCDAINEIQVTIACDDGLTEWTYQTGDNSYTGSCYHYPHWGVGYVSKWTEGSFDELANEIVEEMLDSAAQAGCEVD